jgi:AcrR family transcriptional regulator
VQARSAASVEAILEATVQVLLQLGKERLTTTNVAARAGVSVGTLYQYFPNKSALLQAALKRHLLLVAEAVESVCKEQEGGSLRAMVTVLVTAFLQAKLKDIKTSVAMYAVSSDVDGAKIVHQMSLRLNKAIVRMLTNSPELLASDPQLVASVLQGMLAGVSRRIVESGASAARVAELGKELIYAACAYVEDCRVRAFDADIPA